MSKDTLIYSTYFKVFSLFLAIINFQHASIRYKKPKRPFKYTCHVNSFQKSMVVPLTLLQILSIFPLEGIKRNSYKCLNVKMYSWKMAYAIFSVILHIIHLIVFCSNWKHTVSISSISTIILVAESNIQVLLFLYFAFSWRYIVQQWEHVEKSMRRYEGPRMNIKNTFDNIMVILLVGLVVDYPAFLSQIENKNIRDYEPCYWKVALEITQYIVALQRIFLWAFKDILLMLISICFGYRLQQIDERLSFLIRTRVDNVEIWRATREDYIKLLNLCHLINRKFSWAIIISYIGNMANLLCNLFYAVAYKNTFGYSRIILVIVRLILVTFYGGSLHGENENILRRLLSVPSDLYNKEVEWFVYHVATNEMILTGKNFFVITRSLILQIANTLVTYELVTVQFVQNLGEIE